MFLDYLALAILVMGLLVTFYGFIYVHDIPYKIAKERRHPYAEAIHVGGWLSLFTLHAIWPFVWIWAVSYRRPGDGPADPAAGDVSTRLAGIEARLTQIESADSGGHATGGRIHA